MLDRLIAAAGARVPAAGCRGVPGEGFAATTVVGRSHTIDGRKSFIDVFERLKEGTSVIALRPAPDRRSSKKRKPQGPKKKRGRKR